ncbi:MAG: response regulator transcription factor [Chitinophagales bacterium]
MVNNTIKISIVEHTNNWMNSLTKAVYNTSDLQLVSTYTNAENALQKLWKDSPDVVVMGIELPQMNGIDCMVQLRQKAPHIPFLMFTNHENSKFVFASLKGGALGYILKNEGTEGVIEGVRELIAGGSPMSRNIARKITRSFQPADSLMEKISNRERQILHLLSQGLLYKEIANQLKPQISEGTVKQHIHRIYRKLKVNNRTEAINKYWKYV